MLNVIGVHLNTMELKMNKAHVKVMFVVYPSDNKYRVHVNDVPVESISPSEHLAEAVAKFHLWINSEVEL